MRSCDHRKGTTAAMVSVRQWNLVLFSNVQIKNVAQHFMQKEIV